jgi:hypothetical protein
MTEPLSTDDSELIAQIESISSLPVDQRPEKLARMEAHLRSLLNSSDDKA